MKNIVCRLSAFVLALLMTLLVSCNAPADTSEIIDDAETTTIVTEALIRDEPAEDEISATIYDIAKYGDLILMMSGAELLDKGYEYGDLFEIEIAGQTFELPMCSNYSDVDNGELVMRVSAAEDAVVVAINMGDFATTAKIAKKSKIEEDPGYRWDYLVEIPVAVKISLKEAGAYREEWLVRQLVRTDAREDYAHLSDEAFANFRVVDTTGMGAGKLYRSSSPINPGIGRSTYADAAAKNAGIVTVINLADASNTYALPIDAYYNSCQVTYLNLGMEFLAETFTESLAVGMRAIINGEGPYLIHCNEGKDRAGFVSALLECLMGATVDEVADDYMETYINYYGVEKGSEKYDAVLNNNLIKSLNAVFGVDDIYTADLAIEAEAYMTEKLGLSADEVTTLRAKLGA